MNFIIENWSLLVLLLAFVILLVLWVRKFVALPSETQLTKVKEWLLYAVVMAEKELGAGTGAIKLRYVYSLFIERFPSLVAVISFDLFSQYVDEALVQMKQLLATNKDIEAYVND